ncbi:dihydropteroate synthase [Halomicroarcula sp. F13]|uniref:Probable bifunctional folylpolyglutamate synthase/dihydropteroate synthase n=1 Tax=Haloarcula rubra TaxID=2487747 RepID=A0AAW4PS79_9EURY|nr:dihydropteroate synthase [Halomicroarcula rubra]MBX0324458.1 dihydropteroate synthase [Halomicroarcula rubra]
MEYHESADYLQSLQRRRPKLGTETTARMLSHLGTPQASVDCVQIAGSNGKGSTARMLESVLRTAGLDVGLFTSPALNDFREQVTVNGRKVPKERVTEFVERIDPCLERLRADDDMPTHFEVLTALALYHFGAEDVDVAVLEVGIGGRYDATSAVDPVASAVTSVSLEHTDLLGDTVEEIARDKAQVAPADGPLVTGADGAALDAIRTESDVIQVGGEDADVSAVENGMSSAVENHVSITGPDWAVATNLKLLGKHQATNAGVAATLARQVASIDEQTIADGLRKATWPGRFEVRSTDPLIVLDGSHNPGAVATLSDLLSRYDYDDLHLVFAAMGGKDIEEMVAELPPVDTAYATRPAVDRAATVETLGDALAGHAETVQRIESVPEATERAIAAADESDCVLVAGSLYAVAEARDRWTRTVVPKDAGPSSSVTLTARADGGTTADGVDSRVLSTTLRPEQAAVVSERLESIGGTCVRTDRDAPEKLVSTTLSGAPTQLRALASSLTDEGHGLGHLAEQLGAVLEGPPSPPAIDTEGTAVMGILNVTPDSFHDGGEYNRLDAAVERAEEMVAAGADILDVGGESTRPGADPVPASEEIDRVVPVIETLSSLDVPISVDTRKAAVADAALDAGADIVNDVSGLSDPEMRFVVADHDASLVLMHSLSAPVDPDRTVTYDDVVADVVSDLREQILLAEQAGLDREQIIVDPGCGFGKDAAESFALVDRLAELRALGCPVMVGHSRKTMFERVDCSSGDRLPPTIAVTTMAAERNVEVVRVHDVEENVAAVRTVSAANDV